MAAVREGAGPLEECSVSWLGMQDGLPGGGASCMVQADDGYVWFGTYHGIARFDGVHFKVFTPENTPEIPHLCVSHAHRDRTGRLWFSTVEGMVSHASGRWTRHGPEDGWASNSALTFSDGADGVMYVTGHDGKVLRRVGDRFEEVQGVPAP